MLLTKEAEYKVNSRSLQYYRDKGYQCNVGDIILVKVEDLKKNSKPRVEYQCDKCGEVFDIEFRNFMANRETIYDKTYCVKCANEILHDKKRQEKGEYFAKDGKKKCTKCQRVLSADTDHFFRRVDIEDGFDHKCKECHGKRFTNYLTHVPREGYVFCKKCDRELPHTYNYFPEDKNCKNGLRNVCRECASKSYGRFLPEDHIKKEYWTEDDRNKLREVYPHYTNQEIIDKFFPNRTLRSIGSQADMYDFVGKSEETKIRINEIRSAWTKKFSTGRIVSEETRQKLSEIRKEYYKTHVSWWKGKKRSVEQCLQISERNIRLGRWKGENNPRHINPLSGSLNGNWQGGITPFYHELRSDTKDWIQDSMEFCGYSCVVSGGNFDAIHHTTPFRDIVDETFAISKLDKRVQVKDYSVEEFDYLTEVLKVLHTQYGFGACVHEKIHTLFHNIYGYKNFTAYDFLDFIYRIDVGEFDEWFAEQSLNIDINYNYIEYLENTLSTLS